MDAEASGAPENYSVCTAETVSEFLELLLTNHAQWAGARRGELAYRGQAASSWGLVPKAFRAGEVVGYEAGGTVPRHDRVVPQARAEFEAVRHFVKAADKAGLDIGEAGGRLLLAENPRRTFDDPDWEYRWPQDEVLEALALAQHHGVPTRLLDSTEDPLVAAYFAAEKAWDPKEGCPVVGEGRTFLAVWIIDLRFIRDVYGVRHRYPERIGEVRLPRANNSYLHAQAGFFLLDRGANDVMHKIQSLSIDEAVGERARFWHNGDRLRGNNLEITWFDELPIRKVRLRTALTGELLKELDRRDINKGTLMPSLDGVVEGLEILRSIPEGEGDDLQ